MSTNREFLRHTSRTQTLLKFRNGLHFLRYEKSLSSSPIDKWWTSCSYICCKGLVPLRRSKQSCLYNVSTVCIFLHILSMTLDSFPPRMADANKDIKARVLDSIPIKWNKWESASMPSNFVTLNTLWRCNIRCQQWCTHIIRFCGIVTPSRFAAASTQFVNYG